MESGTQGEMASLCQGEATRACFDNCCSCTNPFVLSRNPTLSPSESAAARLYEFTSSTLSSLPCLNTDFTNHESLPSLTESFSIFEKAYPQFSLTEQADEIRARNFPHLSFSSHVCLDYIGHGLFSSTPQIPSTSSSSNQPSDSNSSNSFFDIIYESVSLNSLVLRDNKKSEFESSIRKRIFRFMNVSEDDYSMVFTANKSAAFKLLADTYPFDSSRNLLTVYDHESEAVEMMTENAVERGAINKTAEFSWPDLRIESKRLRYLVENKKNKKNKGLFVFPLQSSLTGARHSFLWMSLARGNGWDVLLDASALGAKDMETLGLSLFQPDFLFCSFYKVFGENPSGFGCLFIKKSSLSVLNESKNVGFVRLVPPQKPELFEISKYDLAEQSDENSEIQEIVEPNMTLKELEFRGLDSADTLGLIVISNRAKYLVNWLVNALLSLKHPNSAYGLSLVTIYGPKIKIDRGPALAFNVFDWKGEKINPELVQKLADRNNISLGCGIVKHIRFSDMYMEERGRYLEKISSTREIIFSGIHVLNASFGFLTNFEDVYRLWTFVSRFLDADFVEKERWRYKALNQKTIEV